MHTNTHTLEAAKAAAAEAVTSLLGRRVTNEPEHIVLALEMSRGVKMSPQIAPGHQMSPFHSTPHPSLAPLFLSHLFLICLSFSFFSLHHFSTYTALFLSVLSCSPLILPRCFPFHLLKRAQRGRVTEPKNQSFLNSAPLMSALSSSLSSSYISPPSFLQSIHSSLYLSIHQF